MSSFMRLLSKLRTTSAVTIVAVALLAVPSVSFAVICDDPDTVGGGQLGVSTGLAGPVGPPASLGWDVGSGQCNGSFTRTANNGFAGGAIELALRAEQRSAGQVVRVGANEYVVQTGSDTTQPNPNRAWWNFQESIAYNGDIDDLDTLTFSIQTISGPSVPSAPAVDLLAARAVIDDRNNNPNATSGYGDLYQISQNPVFGWFSSYDFNDEGAWILRLTAVEGQDTASVSICVRTPNASCPPPQVPASTPWGMALLGLIFAAGLGWLGLRLRNRPRLA